ncbi:MAG TPA: thermonuclease family protein [Candidatus Salinicoccus stercoripullorum]|uniref:Thermonuclease family protein n=1 Tax=Candidatus Salinicoccus stercoripullorum TaxID=2838756 RepID=A0A9D1QHU8_9STAP|nr:thermonuclease family protein [Candidatus Salinicoccus stercoripullorum]
MEEKPGEPRSEPEISGNDQPADRILVTVDEFIDGDTTRFNYEGSSESFRYLMIDTPETKHSRHGEEPFGSEAAERTRELLQDAEKIEVEFDAGPAQDDYGRYLVYVYADGEMINEILVREGLAEVTYVNPPNDTHADLLYEAQERAQSEDLGIWSETN